MFSKAYLLIKRLFSLSVITLLLTVYAHAAVADDSNSEAEENVLPVRTSDHRYGMALYEFYQQNYYQALTELAIANASESTYLDQSISSDQPNHPAQSTNTHGYQPDVMKGAMYLSFGLEGDAKQTFEEILLSDDNNDSGVWGLDYLMGDEGPLSDRATSLIWFYLGKVFYQSGNSEVAYSSLERVDIDELEQYQTEITEDNNAKRSDTVFLDVNVVDEYHNMMGELYLGLGNIELAQYHLQEISIDSPLSNYLGYNLALALNEQGLWVESQEALDVIIERSHETAIDPDDLEDESDEVKRSERERKALTDRVYLTKGIGYLTESQFQEAMEPLEKISLNGPLSDQALFTYGVAATKANDFSLAMGAIQALMQKESVSPVIYESYFAMGYLYEQMNKKAEALAAYKLSVSYYAAVLKDLEDDLNNPSDNHLLTRYFTDQPANELIADLFSKAHYQLAVEHVRQLETLEKSFDQWLKKIDSFEVMIETRKLARDQRVQQTRAKLNSDAVKSISTQRDELASTLSEKSNAQAVYFFMNQEQKDNLRLIAKVKRNVAAYKKQLSDLNESTADYDDYLERIERVERFFYWQASEDFPVTRWEAQSSLNSLDRVLAELDDRTSQLEALVTRSEQIEVLEQRIATIKPRLLLLSEEANNTSLAAKHELSSLIAGELKAQAERVGRFLSQASIAQARLSDEMLEARSYE